MNLMMKLGLYTKEQYNKIRDELSEVQAQFKEMRTRWEETCLVRDAAVVAGKTLAFNFDGLIAMYNETQLNAMFYKMVTRIHDTESERHLFERWIKRLNDSKSSLKHVKANKYTGNA